ncbi:brix domain-containing protein [Haematococcus lacustris]|uniref:Brix domain-containing protein n=1 Tax=Haematococcus lacustris TaxID=44745 RepID=A0A699YSQ5_HAELA|nr:brix domain-containing protein [Haematococcus lacustris]
MGQCRALRLRLGGKGQGTTNCIPCCLNIKSPAPTLFEMKLYQIKLGTVDQDHVENEWVLRSYTRAAKKQRLADETEPATAGR